MEKSCRFVSFVHARSLGASWTSIVKCEALPYHFGFLVFSLARLVFSLPPETSFPILIKTMFSCYHVHFLVKRFARPLYTPLTETCAISHPALSTRSAKTKPAAAAAAPKQTVAAGAAPSQKTCHCQHQCECQPKPETTSETCQHRRECQSKTKPSKSQRFNAKLAMDLNVQALGRVASWQRLQISHNGETTFPSWRR